MSILDLILRVIAVISTLASAIAMGTTNETLPLFTPFIQFKARYSDLPALTYVRKNLQYLLVALMLLAPSEIINTRRFECDLLSRSPCYWYQHTRVLLLPLSGYRA